MDARDLPRRRTRRHLRPVALIATCCAAFAVATGTLAVLGAIASHGWKISALVRMGKPPLDERLGEIARATDPSFVLVKEGRYDGVFYYAIARDPILVSDEHKAIDRPAYRYGHPGYGWLATVASAGQAAAVPAALLAVGLLGLAVAGAAGSLLSGELGRTHWGGLLVAFNPGLIYAVTSDTTEAAGAALLLLALLAYMRGRVRLAALALVPLCFVKEPFLLVPVALALWELLALRRRGRPPDLVTRAAVLAAGPLLYAGWYAYVQVRIGASPLSQAEKNLAGPLLGWKAALLKSGSRSFDPRSGALTQVGQIAVPLLAVVGAALFVGLVVAFRRRLATPLDAVFVLQALLVFCASDLTLAFPKDLVRTVSMPLLLLPAVLVGPRRVWRNVARCRGAMVVPSQGRRER